MNEHQDTPHPDRPRPEEAAPPTTPRQPAQPDTAPLESTRRNEAQPGGSGTQPLPAAPASGAAPSGPTPSGPTSSGPAPSGPTSSERAPSEPAYLEAADAAPPPGAPPPGAPPPQGPPAQGPPPQGPPPQGPPPQGPPPQGPPQWGPTADRLADRLRALRRSRNERIFAGVCGGVARGLGIDPLLLRVIAVVLTFFGGAGIVLYALGWLLLPVDDGEPSLGAQLTDRRTGRPSSRTALLAVVLVVAVTLGVLSAFRRWDGPLLLALAAVGLIVYVLREPAPPAALAAGPGAPGGAVSGVPGQLPARSGASAAGPSGATAFAATAPVPTAAAGPPATASATPPWQGPPGAPPAPPQPPMPPAPPRERSMLGGLTISAVLVALGVLAAVDVSGFDLPHGAYPALALTVVGLGLLVGTWLGRARGLVWLGLVLAVVTLAASVTGPWQDRQGEAGVDLNLKPTSVTQLPTNAEYSAGQVRYDLTAVPFEGQAARLGAHIGFGEIVVTVPRDVDVTVHASAGIGGIDLLDADSTGGVGTDRTVTDLGPDGAGGGRLNLNLQAGIGHLEVRRATA